MTCRIERGLTESRSTFDDPRLAYAAVEIDKYLDEHDPITDSQRRIAGRDRHNWKRNLVGGPGEIDRRIAKRR